MHSSDSNYKKKLFTFTCAGKEPTYFRNLFKDTDIIIVYVAANSLEHNLITKKEPQRVSMNVMALECAN
jgi:lactate dehydrogenase-like 2-hydroxyacid dehydrogenase